MTPPVNRRPLRTTSILLAIKDHVLLLFTLLGVMWLLEIIDLLPFVELDRYGIQPRTASGLAGILSAPFLHVGFGHLIVNSLPLIVLGGIVLLSGLRVFWKVTAFVTLGGGLGVWLFAESFSNHLGASGVIFGYLGFLLGRGFFARSFASMLTAGAVLVVYGSLLFGVLPTQSGVSWEGHLFGFFAGIAAARVMSPPLNAR